MIQESFGRIAGSIHRRLSVGSKSVLSELEDRADPVLEPATAWWQAFLRGAEITVPAVVNRKIRVVDAFCGCGGLTLGARQAAIALGTHIEPVAAIDLDHQGLDVYRANFKPTHTFQRNVSSLVDFHVSDRGDRALFAYPPEVLDAKLGSEVGNIDLFLAGPPCQGHSNLNNHTRRDDPRNLLYLAAIGLAVALESRAIVIENVPDIMSDRGEAVSTAKALLRQSGYSYLDQATFSVDELGGAQTRRRLFLVAARNPTSSVLPRLVDVVQSLRRDAAPLQWAIGDLLDTELSGFMHSVPAFSLDNQRRIDYLFDNDLYDLPDPQRPECHQEGNTYKSVYGRLRWDKPAQTITTGFLTPGRGRFIHPLKRRVLTPREAARIQFFPDTFVFSTEPTIEPGRGALTKWIGDAVPPILGYAASLAAIIASS